MQQPASALALSSEEQRFLLAAYSASPQYWFRSKVVGRNAAFGDPHTASLLSSLVAAGLMIDRPDHSAQLTQAGCSAALMLSSQDQHGQRTASARRRRWMILGCVLACVTASLALLWLGRVS